MSVYGKGNACVASRQFIRAVRKRRPATRSPTCQGTVKKSLARGLSRPLLCNAKGSRVRSGAFFPREWPADKTRNESLSHALSDSRSNNRPECSHGSKNVPTSPKTERTLARDIGCSFKEQLRPYAHVCTSLIIGRFLVHSGDFRRFIRQTHVSNRQVRSFQ